MTTGNQKVAVITGASQGIGAALVQAYRKLGWAVVANSRSIKGSDDAGVVTVAGDIADPTVARTVIETAVRDFGRVDTLVNNAGVFIAKPFADYTEEDYQALIGVNLTAFVTTTQLAIAQMLRQGEGGHVVQITTSLVDHANSNVPSVLASLTKGGLQSATKSLAIEFAKQGVRVNAVSPGIIQTRCTRRSPTTGWPGYTRWAAWVSSATSSTVCSTWRTPRSSPARSCTSTEARAPVTDPSGLETDRLARNQGPHPAVAGAN